VRFDGPSEPVFSTDLQKVIVAPETGSNPDFGILDLKPQEIHEPPQFTENATIVAMRNLNVSPEDLVPQEPEISDIPLRVSTKLELERRRYQTIQNILAERNRILELPALDIALPNRRRARRVHRKHQKKVNAPSASTQIPTVVATPIKIPPPLSIVRRRRVAIAPDSFDEDEAKRLRQLQIQRGAQWRLARAMVEESTLARRRRQLRDAAEARMQEQARVYMRLQERKQRALAAEREWRRANVYAGARDQRGNRKNPLSELRQKFLSALSQPPPQVEPLRAVVPIADVGPAQNRRSRPAQSFDANYKRGTIPVITATSGDVARTGMLRWKLPIVGNGRTRIPQLRK
jgi:hypothetical protein